MKLWRLGVRNFKGLGDSRVYHFMSKSTRKINKQTLNDGRSLFLKKWGISSNVFTRNFLRRGELWVGPLPDPSFNFFLQIRIAFSKIFIFLRFK